MRHGPHLSGPETTIHISPGNAAATGLPIYHHPAKSGAGRRRQDEVSPPAFTTAVHIWYAANRPVDAVHKDEARPVGLK